MRLNALHLVNFRQHADSRIEFDLGVTGIIGPNGSGKTTVLEAIAWALYGQTAARGTRDSIRFVRAGPRAPVRVELDFDLAGHRYRVVRGLTSAELYFDGGAEPIANTITGVTEHLQRRLGMTHAEFFNTYFTGQKELGAIANMKAGERSRFLSRVLGYDKLRLAQSLTRERRNSIAAELVGMRNGMTDPDEVLRSHDQARQRFVESSRLRDSAERTRKQSEEALASIAPRWEAAQQRREEIQQVAAEIRVIEEQEASHVRETTRIERELAEIGAARVELDHVIAEMSQLNESLGEYRRLDELAREEGRRRALADELRSLDEELARIRDRQAKIAGLAHTSTSISESLDQTRHGFEEATNAWETRRTEWVRDRQEAETKRDQMRRQYTELKVQRDKIVDLGEDGVCPTCMRILGGHFRTVLDQLDEQLETVTVDGRWFATRLEQLNDQPADLTALDTRRKTLSTDVATLERQLVQSQAAARELEQTARELATKDHRRESLQRDLTSIPGGYDAAKHEALKPLVERFGRLNEDAARLNARVEREPSLQLDRQRVQDELDAVRKQLGTLRARREASRYTEENYAELRAEFESTTADLRQQELRLSVARADEANARDAKGRADEAVLEMERMRARLDLLETDRRLHNEVDQAFSDLRSDLNRELRPELSELAGSFIADLTDGRYSELDIDDDYNVILLEDGTPKPVISGGEEDLSHLALRLAVSQMIAERAGQSFSLLVLDEVFGSLDEAHRSWVVSLLRRLHDRFEQVILITHVEGVRDELDRLILVEYDEESGSSRVRQPDITPPDLLEDGALERAGAAGA